MRRTTAKVFRSDGSTKDISYERLMSAPCHHCGIYTTPTAWVDGQPEVAGPWEWYMVHDHVWAAAGMSKLGYLCIACLELRLGRQLTWQDFTEYPVNLPRSTITERLEKALTRGSPEGLSRAELVELEREGK